MSNQGAPQNIFSISADRPFVDALARGVIDRYGKDPLTLSDVLILLPTRRACRSLREAFLRVMDGQALLLPRMRPIGDVDEDELVLAAPGEPEGAFRELLDLPPAISETERLLQLSRLVQAHRDGLAEEVDGLGRIGPDQALLLARELAHFLNQVQTEGLTLDGLDALVPEDYADHWIKTLQFLDILRTVWPDYLHSTGQMDPAARRDALLRAQAQAWRNSKPRFPVIAAGSTGSIPATAALICAVAEMPQGSVVLPGLDTDLDGDSWEAVRSDPTHAQHGLYLLLDRLECTRSAVQPWLVEAAENIPMARSRLISEALRPAAVSGKWRELSDIDASAFNGVTWLSAPSPAAEATLVAQGLREVLETPGKTAALVTPDRTLARRVAAQMTRWGIQIDDTAGMSLGNTEAGRFFKLISEAAAQRLAPVALLALLKHPLAAAGAHPPAFRASVRSLEIALLRGPKPAAGLEGLRALREAKSLEPRGGGENGSDAPQLDRLDRVIEALDISLGPFVAEGHSTAVPFKSLLEAHLAAAEALAAAADSDGEARLWSGEDGEALADFLAGLVPHADLLGQVSVHDYNSVMDALMTGQTVRPRYGAHPRVFIMGPLEARLWQADRMILGGLNEGTWPPEPPQDPWMSRDMRSRFGLPAHQRRIGLSAHDFAQAMSATEVTLIRAEKSGGQQTVPARWLERLATVLEQTGLAAKLPKGHGLADQFMVWQAKIDAADRLPPLAPPNPKPPLRRRPTRLSATRVQTLIENPYEIFASRVLGLRPLDPLEADLGAADKGTMIHNALDAFARAHPDRVPNDALDILLEMGRQAFGADTLARPAVWAFWWPRFVRIAEWFIAEERIRRPRLSMSRTEIKGTLSISVGAMDFTLSAEADRIDRFQRGGYAILDYKTGGMPSAKKVALLAAPQLPLEAAILASGGFPEVAPEPILELAYWKLTGGDPAGQVQTNNAADPNDLAVSVREKLEALIHAYTDPDRGYPAVPRASFEPLFDDYGHLSRRKEWGLSEAGGALG